jgi:hypothetical protein
MPSVLETEETLIEIEEPSTEPGYGACAQSDAYEECRLSWERPLDVLVRTHPYIYVDALLG